MANARAVVSYAKNSGVLYILDCCRIAENAYFIKHREEGFEIIRMKHSTGNVPPDGWRIMSAKKMHS